MGEISGADREKWQVGGWLVGSSPIERVAEVSLRGLKLLLHHHIPGPYISGKTHATMSFSLHRSSCLWVMGTKLV